MALSKTAGRVLVLFLAVLPLILLAVLYPRLPDVVPVHYNSHMEPDRLEPKAALRMLHGFMSAMSIGLYFLLRNLHRIDPKRKGHEQSSTFNKLAVGIVAFMTALQGVILLATAGHEVFLAKGIFIILGALFAFLGNYLHSIKPNYFAGFRLPWTLEDEENWRLTHRLGGKLWVAAGALIVVVGLVLDGPVLTTVVFCIIGVAVVVPAVYSWRIFRGRKGVESGG